MTQRLDTGYRVMDYRNSADPGGTLHGVDENGNGDGEVTCEELWENSLVILDEWGQQKEAAEKYQKLRRLIEKQTRRPIPWVLEAPTIGISSKKRRSLEKSAEKIRLKVRSAINFLEKLLAPLKAEDPVKYQRCLIACLYWFVLVPENGQGIPPEFESFLARQDINADVIQRIRGEFSKYLQKNGGGLGLIHLGDPDAKFEATALETVLGKKGWCTEQSKVMYAVLRMAGIKASFVEPRLSVEYLLAKARPEEKEKLKELADTPLRSHMASGVAVELLDENGEKSFWVIDVTSKLLEADYIRENPGQWEVHPYWELSLRHFYMADLANLGRDQTRQGDFLGAKRSFKRALDLGEDSTAYHVKGNLAHLLSKKSERLSPRSKNYKQDYEELNKGIDRYSKMVVEMNPYNPAFQFDRGRYLAGKRDRRNSQESVATIWKAIDNDPRFILAYQALGRLFYRIFILNPDRFPSDWREAVWKTFKEGIQNAKENHSSFLGTIKEGIGELKEEIEKEFAEWKRKAHRRGISKSAFKALEQKQAKLIRKYAEMIDNL